MVRLRENTLICFKYFLYVNKHINHNEDKFLLQTAMKAIHLFKSSKILKHCCFRWQFLYHSSHVVQRNKLQQSGCLKIDWKYFIESHFKENAESKKKRKHWKHKIKMTVRIRLGLSNKYFDDKIFLYFGRKDICTIKYMSYMETSYSS